jgi:hypothetical protein
MPPVPVASNRLRDKNLGRCRGWWACGQRRRVVKARPQDNRTSVMSTPVSPGGPVRPRVIPPSAVGWRAHDTSGGKNAIRAPISTQCPSIGHRPRPSMEILTLAVASARVEAALVNWPPSSALKISGWPKWANASASADAQDDWSAASARTPRYRSGASSGVPACGRPPGRPAAASQPSPASREPEERPSPVQLIDQPRQRQFIRVGRRRRPVDARTRQPKQRAR